MRASRSEALFERAVRVMAGGVSSPVRAFKAVGGEPLFISRGKGQRTWDVDGNEFIDYVLSWGPLILGHAHPAVTAAVQRVARRGTSFGAPNEQELELAEEVSSLIPSIEKVRFVNSGTEATMSALRLARAFTGRRKVIKFAGCYHGHADVFLSDGGSGLATFDIPASAGVTEATVSETITVPYNDLESVRRAVEKLGQDLAAVIVEPVAGNMGVVAPVDGFLDGLRQICTENGSLLIFDEVITGFRLSKGGAQQLFSVRPDITCLGKIIGGGFPVGAYGGSRAVMGMLSPEGPVYQAGTLAGNPVAMAAGLATLSRLNEGAYSKLERLSSMLERGLLDASRAVGLPLTVNRVGSMIGIFFTANQVVNFEGVKRTAHALYPSFHRLMLESGVYLPPSPFETIFLSTSHRPSDIDATVTAASRAFKRCKR